MLHLRAKYGTDAHGFFWPDSAQKRAEMLSVKRGSPADFEATYQCRPGQRQGTVFLASDLTYYQNPPDLQGGILAPGVREIVKNCHCVLSAWDTAFSQTVTSAYTCCVTAGLLACNQYHRDEDEAVWGPCEHHFDVIILDVRRKRLDWGGLNAEFRNVHALWQPERHVIEKRASGISLVQNMLASGLPIEGVDVRDSKLTRAISAKIGDDGRVSANTADGTKTSKTAASTQGWFRQHRVKLPVYAPWLQPYISELLDFSGADDAASDQVDSTVHLVTKAIEMSATTSMLPSEWQPTASAGIPVLAAAEQERQQANSRMLTPRGQTLQFIGELPMGGFDPLESSCARCKSLVKRRCQLTGRAVTPFDSCAGWTAKEI